MELFVFGRSLGSMLAQAVKVLSQRQCTMSSSLSRVRRVLEQSRVSLNRRCSAFPHPLALGRVWACARLKNITRLKTLGYRSFSRRAHCWRDPTVKPTCVIGLRRKKLYNTAWSELQTEVQVSTG
jgi:hypothetical protein